MTRTSHLRRIAAAAAAVAAITALSACGDDSSTTNDTASTPNDSAGPGDSGDGTDKKALKKTVADYIPLIFKADGDAAFQMVSTRCRDFVGGSGDQFTKDLEPAAIYGPQTAQNVTVDSANDRTARVTYDVGDGTDTLDEFTRTGQQWTVEDRAWKWDACPNPNGTGKPSPVSQDVTLTKAGQENHPTWGKNAYVVHYKITNNGDRAANYFVQLAFLDADGNQLGTTGITADAVGPGKTSTGNTAPIDAEIENGDMADVTAVQVLTLERN